MPLTFDDDEEVPRLRRDRTEKMLGGRAYLEPTKVQHLALAYCCKELDVYTNIVKPEDLPQFQAAIKTLFSVSTCRDFIGNCLENILFNYCPSFYKQNLDMYSQSGWVETCLDTHKHFHKC